MSDTNQQYSTPNGQGLTKNKSVRFLQLSDQEKGQDQQKDSKSNDKKADDKRKKKSSEDDYLAAEGQISPQKSTVNPSKKLRNVSILNQEVNNEKKQVAVDKERLKKRISTQHGLSKSSSTNNIEIPSKNKSRQRSNNGDGDQFRLTPNLVQCEPSPIGILTRKKSRSPAPEAAAVEEIPKILETIKSQQKYIQQLATQNRELTNAVSQLNESLKIMNINYTRLQKNQDEKYSKLECDNIELKNRVSYLETKISSNHQSQGDQSKSQKISHGQPLNQFLEDDFHIVKKHHESSKSTHSKQVNHQDKNRPSTQLILDGHEKHYDRDLQSRNTVTNFNSSQMTGTSQSLFSTTTPKGQMQQPSYYDPRVQQKSVNNEYLKLQRSGHSRSTERLNLDLDSNPTHAKSIASSTDHQLPASVRHQSTNLNSRQGYSQFDANTNTSSLKHSTNTFQRHTVQNFPDSSSIVEYQSNKMSRHGQTTQSVLDGFNSRNNNHIHQNERQGGDASVTQYDSSNYQQHRGTSSSIIANPAATHQAFQYNRSYNEQFESGRSNQGPQSRQYNNDSVAGYSDMSHVNNPFLRTIY